MPEAAILCPDATIWLEKEGRNGYFRLRLLAGGAYRGGGREKRPAEGPEESPWIGRYNAHKGGKYMRLSRHGAGTGCSTALYLTAPLRGSGRYNA